MIYNTEVNQSVQSSTTKRRKFVEIRLCLSKQQLLLLINVHVRFATFNMREKLNTWLHLARHHVHWNSVLISTQFTIERLWVHCIFFYQKVCLSQFSPTQFHSYTGLRGTQDGVARFMLGSDLYFVYRSVHWVSRDVFVSNDNGRNPYIMLQLEVD